MLAVPIDLIVFWVMPLILIFSDLSIKMLWFTIELNLKIDISACVSIKNEEESEVASELIFTKSL